MSEETDAAPVVRPPALRPGDTIALVAPSRPPDPQRLSRAAVWLQDRGYQVRQGKRVHERYHYLAGRDADRARDVMDAFLDDDIAGLLCVRGGFGTGRMVDLLDYTAIAAHPKALIGFSDSTGLQLAVYSRARLVTFTGALADIDLGGRSVDPLLADSLWRLLERPEPFGDLPAECDTLVSLRPGQGSGPLVAANLTLLCSLLGTPYAPRLDGSVLLIEDVGEAPYRIDRMLSQLRLAGIFDRLAALVLGSFRDCFVPAEMQDSPTLEEMVADAVGDRPLPVVGGVAYGHMPRRTVLPIGVVARVDGDAATVAVTEPAVH
ncbi:MAG: LD-carboxypeptidase [Candidatus Latescibacterota bacterium]